jgi:hypothetical protein
MRPASDRRGLGTGEWRPLMGRSFTINPLDDGLARLSGTSPDPMTDDRPNASSNRSLTSSPALLGVSQSSASAHLSSRLTMRSLFAVTSDLAEVSYARP